MTISYFENTNTHERAAFLTKDVNPLIVAMNRQSQGDVLVERTYPDTPHNRQCVLEKRYDDLSMDSFPRDLVVFQDGADFYTEEAHIATAPMKVLDHDMEAAEAARTWFVDVYCPANNINPTF